MTLTHTYSPRGACKEIFERRDRELLVVGPAGTGKSRAIMEKVNLMALLNANSRYLIVRKTYRSLRESTLQPWKEVTHEARQAGYCTPYGGEETPSHYSYANGSRVVFGGMDKPTKILSTEYDLIFVEEAIELTEADWEPLTTRLRNGVVSFQQIIGSTNPGEEEHWLRKRCQSGVTKEIISRHTDNPVYWDEDSQEWTDAGKAYIDGLRNSLSGTRKRRYLDGEWSSAEGVIYEDWDSGVHLIDAFDIPDHWTRYWSVDFGVANPTVIQHWAEDADGRLYLYREFYMTGKTTDQHAQDVLKVVAPEGKWLEPKPKAIICDHDQESQLLLRRELGMSTRNAKKDVLTGIEAVTRRLRPHEVDGKPRLYIFRDARVQRDESLANKSLPTSTAEEVGGYVWDITDRRTKDEPVKENDHGMDAMRYMVMHRERKGVRVR